MALRPDDENGGKVDRPDQLAGYQDAGQAIGPAAVGAGWSPAWYASTDSPASLLPVARAVEDFEFDEALDLVNQIVIDHAGAGA